MKLIGHELVPYEPLFWRENAQQIEAGKQNLSKFDAAAIKRAQELGAEGVVGVDIDYEALGTDNGMLMVTASGTAVRFSPVS